MKSTETYGSNLANSQECKYELIDRIPNESVVSWMARYALVNNNHQPLLSDFRQVGFVMTFMVKSQTTILMDCHNRIILWLSEYVQPDEYVYLPLSVYNVYMLDNPSLAVQMKLRFADDFEIIILNDVVCKW